MNIVLLIIGVVVLLLISASLFLYWIGKSGSNLAYEIQEASPYRKKYPEQIALNDPLARNKVYEKKIQEQRDMGVAVYDPQGLAQQEDKQIIGLAEPIGLWTRFVMGQKMGYIKMRASMHGDSKNFWTTLIKAQASSQGKDQGRGR